MKERITMARVAREAGVNAVRVVGQDGRTYGIVVNFGAEAVQVSAKLFGGNGEAVGLTDLASGEMYSLAGDTLIGLDAGVARVFSVGG